MRKVTILFVVVSCVTCALGAVADAANVEFKVVAFKSIDTGLVGNIAGAAPPVLVLVESAEEADRISEDIAEAYPGAKGTFREALGEYKEMDFDRYTYAAIFTRPIDNYALKVNSVTHERDENLVTIKFSYTWERRQYFRAPNLRIYFAVIRLQKTGAAIVADYGTERLPLVLKPVKIGAILPVAKEPEKRFEVSASGMIALNEAAERAGEGPFLYVLRSAGDMEKLDAKMKSKFRNADKSVADIIRDEAGADFGRRMYLVLLSAPCASALMVVKDARYDDDMAQTLVSIDYRRIPSAKERRSNLAYTVIALPRRDTGVVLLVKSEGGERRVLASSLEKRRTAEEKREEYDIRLESADFTIADTLARLGEWCMKNGLFNEGRRHLCRALKFNPLNVRAARALRELAMLEELQKKPATAAEYAQRALVYKGLGRFKDATADIKAALKLDANCAEAHYAGGVYEMFMRNLAVASESLSKAIEIDPSQARYFAARAQCRAMMGKFKPAEKDVALALSLEENSAQALSARATIFLARASLTDNREEARKLIVQARDLWAKAIEIEPDSEEYYSYRALAFLKLMPYDKKKEYLDNAFHDCIKSLQLNPYQYEPHLQLASYYVYKQEPLHAESSLNRAVSGFPNVAYVYEQRGLFYLAVRDNEAAVKDFDRFIELAPDDASGYFNRARAKAGQSKLIEARRDFNKAVELNPREPRYYWERGLFHYNTSNMESALKDFRKALEVGVPNASVYYMIALVQLQTDKYGAAVESLEKCLEMNPDEKMRKEVLKRLQEAKKKRNET